MPSGYRLPLREGCGLMWSCGVAPSGCLEDKKLSQMVLDTNMSALGSFLYYPRELAWSSNQKYSLSLICLCGRTKQNGSPITREVDQYLQT